MDHYLNKTALRGVALVLIVACFIGCLSGCIGTRLTAALVLIIACLIGCLSGCIGIPDQQDKGSTDCRIR